MSKQPHDQDEQQAPSGAQSATSGGGAGKGGASGRRRSRRYDKGGNAAAADSPSAGQEAAQPDRPAATAPAVGQSPGAETAGARPEEKAEKKPEATKAAAGPGATGDARGGAGKGDDKGADKSADKQPAKPAGAAGSKSDTAKPDTAKPAASASGGGPARPAAPAGGGDGKGKSKSGLVAIVLVILLAIAAALFGWQAWQKLDAQQARIAELESRTGELASAADLAGLEDRLDEGERERDAALDGAIQALQGEFADYRGEVNETLDQVLAELASEQETDERDWLHAEAAYLLRLANQRLQLERDVQGAAALLRTADQRLLEADNPALVPVRREIASELAALDAVPRVDRTGLWLALNAQQEQIARQPLAQEIEEITVRAGMEEAPSGTWQQQLSRFGQELKELVTIRHHDAALEALITPEQESYLRQSVRLVLEQSQLALLKEEQALFEASLDKALTLINGYYDTDASGVQSVIGRLEALKGEAIRPELPDISGSQQALATFIERRFESRRGDDA
ncbi:MULTISPECIES: uroporphyrinogen-III C-methyltransferase [Halomonas]|uniref:uroporphyrinogen-III C-methyltransferase n=1 Tax=Halomonas TaxID=2745 RepID=UPI0020B68178|nr:uroporphyrinogen-III C-methyltransferase [Halomonas sp. 3H]